MAEYLVIVESPTKVKTVKKFLGRNYTVAASNGHVRDLPKSSLGIDVEHDFEPKYITIWQSANGIRRQELEEQPDVVHDFAFAPHSSKLAVAVGGKHAQLILWEVRRGEKLRELEEIDPSVTSIDAVAFTQDERRVYFANNFGEIKRHLTAVGQVGNRPRQIHIDTPRTVLHLELWHIQVSACAVNLGRHLHGLVERLEFWLKARKVTGRDCVVHELEVEGMVGQFFTQIFE